jgi:predicted permease
MMPSVATRLVRLACRLYPRGFRDQLADDLAAVFEREYAAKLQTRGRRAALWLLTRTFVGVLWQAAAERLGGLTPRHRRTPVAKRRRDMRGIGNDLRFATRALLRQPFSTAAIVLTLALGIGATTAVYAIFNYVVFRPVPGIAEPERLVTLYVWPDHETPRYGYLSDDHLRAIRAMPAFAGLAPLHGWSFPFRADAAAAPESRWISLVPRGYFDLLGVEPRLGRLFRGEEYDQPGSPVAVISEKLWRSHYGSDPSAIGSDAFILEHRFTIVGVARDFRGHGNIGLRDVWVPQGAAGLAEPNVIESENHGSMVGRLAPGVTLQVARAQAAEAVAAAGGIRVRDQEYTAVVFPGSSDPLGAGGARLMPIFWIAMAGVSSLLLLACVNAANLFVARNVRRRRNLALKAALGASRLRVLREMMVEAVLVAVLASAAGLATGAAMTGLFRSERLLSNLQLEDLSVDWRVAASAALAGCASVLLAAGLPSLLAVRWDPQRGLREFGQGVPRAAGRLRDSFVAIQVALSIALVACTGVLAQTLVNLESKDLGFDFEGLYEVTLRPSGIGYDAERTGQLRQEVERRLADTPGIEAVAAGVTGHLVTGPAAGLATSSGETDFGEHIFVRHVTSSYLRTVGIPLLAGRMFTAQEAAAGRSARVVVIDRSLAEQVFAGQPPVGRQLHLVYGGPAEAYEVIGVAADTGDLALREEHRLALYMPLGSRGLATVHVRSRLPASETAALMRSVIRDIEPLLPVDDIVTVRDRIARFTAQERVLAKLGLVLAGLALGIAIAGVYSAMAGRVSERTQEIGVRMALGASRAAVGMGVLRRAMIVAGLGIAAGLALYAWGARFIEAQLYGVSSLDPATLATATLLILAAALVAAWLPARRATRVDPTIAMRSL